MVNSCSAFGCTARSAKGVSRSFHRSPVNTEKRAAWVLATKRKNFVPSSASYICSDHFYKDCFDISKTSGFCLRKYLKSDAVPTIFDFPEHLKPAADNVQKAPTEIIKKKLNKEEKIEINMENTFKEKMISTDKILCLGDCIKFDSDNLQTVKKKLSFVLDAYKLQKKRIRCVMQQKRRLNKKIAKLQNVINELQGKCLVSDEATATLSSLNPGIKDLIQRKLKSKTNLKYPPSLQTFALTLHFYSAKAYDYVRQFFDTCLPHPDTLRRWYRSVNGQPGFTHEAFQILKSKNDESNKKIICSLMMDEMSIRKQIDWDGHKSYGFIDYGTGFNDDSVGVAKEAFVLLLVAVNGHWKIPVAYFLTDGLNSKEKANIISECLIKVHETGVISLTFDGTAANLSMMKILGADFSDVRNLKPYFQHPVSAEPVFLILDACHMLKLVRNYFGEKKLLKDSNNGVINYAFIERLYELQSKEGIHAANKLKKHHIEWKQQKMKVKLAAQTLSQSVADALDFCENKLKLKEFQGCGPTINFIQFIDKSFDLLNSRNFLGKNYKAPISSSNLEDYANFVNFVCQYLSSLTDSAGKLICKTNCKTGFIGFMFSLQSVIQLSKYLILSSESQFKFLLTYKLSQDHIEMFFSAVRSQGGFNNNPSAKQFMATYRRLLIHHSLKNIKTGNCLAQDATQILSVTGGIVNHQECKFNDDDPTVFIANDITQVNIMEPPQLSEYSEEVVKYISGFVCKKLKRSIKCKACTSSLTDDNSQCLLVEQKSRGGLVHPSKDVIVICTIVEKFLRHSIPDISKIKELQLFTKSIPYLKLNIRRQLISKVIFQGLINHIQELPFEDNHLVKLINLIIDAYLDVRLYHVSSCATSYIQGVRVRNKLTKLVLFKNQ